MDRESVIALINEKESTLDHSGIKGQKWGVRRFQNEDGSLTPEGRRRYGLKSEYSGMSDKELRDALNRKRTENQYIELRTSGIRKKQAEREGLIRAVSDVAGKTVRLGTTGIDIKTKHDIAENKKIISTTTNKELKDKAIEDNKEAGKTLVLTKGLRDVTDKTTGLASSQAGNIAKITVHDELIKATKEAREAMAELDEQELRKTVDRMLLEKQYDELVNPPKPSKVEVWRERLQTAGSIMGVFLSGVLIAQGIKALMKRDVSHSDLEEDYLIHYRTKGSKNGVRRYQNEDGSLTPEGYRHYGIDPNGREAADPREVLIRQRAEAKAQAERIKTQRRVEAGGARYAQRQALREAKNQARIQTIYDKQQAKTEVEMRKVENQAKAENRTNLRMNIIKGAAGVAAIAGAVMVGRHLLKERALNNAHLRDMEVNKLLGKQKLDELRISSGDTVKKVAKATTESAKETIKSTTNEAKKVVTESAKETVKVSKETFDRHTASGRAAARRAILREKNRKAKEFRSIADRAIKIRNDRNSKLNAILRRQNIGQWVPHQTFPGVMINVNS